jgi:periplasmic protein TonB
MSDSAQNRVFHCAILASLALHALLFLGFPDLISSARRAVESFPPPILARLIAPEPAAPAPVPAPPIIKEKPPAPPKAAKPLAIPAPVPEPVPAAKPEPVAPTPPAESVPAPATAEAPPAPVASAPPAQPAAQPGAAAAAAREARTIGEYRLELIEAARRIKDRTRYPPLARDNNWTGNTRVSVAVPPGGAPTVSVRGTSGHQILDEHALRIFRQATREVAVPQELRGRAFVVEVPMVFTLKE